MVQGSGSRNKSKGKGKGKGKGKLVDGGQLNAQLAMLGLKVTHVTADGNCLFRAIADQLERNEEDHDKYRQMVVDYIEDHKEEYEPFVEDEVPFDEYCKVMRECGTWAGNIELQAASLATQTNICIHRLMSPRWQICNFDTKGTRTIHLSYHDGEHYNSVQRINGCGAGQEKIMAIKADDKLLSTPPVKGQKSNLGRVVGKHVVSKDSVRLVMAVTGCTNHERIQEVLQEVHGDTDAAIEFLIANLNATDDGKSSQVLEGTQLPTNGNTENIQDHCLNQSDFVGSLTSDRNISSFDNGNMDVKQPQRNDNGHFSKPQKVARNKTCPCGSKKKYKTCCGAVRQKTAARVLTNSQEVLPNKSRKEKMKRTKARAQQELQSPTSQHDLLDLGSLHI